MPSAVSFTNFSATSEPENRDIAKAARPSVRISVTELGYRTGTPQLAKVSSLWCAVVDDFPA